MIVLLIGGVVVSWQSTNAAQVQAQALTRKCLDGDWKSATICVGEDEQQRAELLRWQIMNFASIQAKVRPTGDRVQIRIEEMQASDQQRIFLVTMSSRFIGERKHLQFWVRDQDYWRFDALASLRDPQRARLLQSVQR
jgi:hypothetical protein